MTFKITPIAMIAVVLLAILNQVFCQNSCGCVSQPTIIHVSCNGQGSEYVSPNQSPPSTESDVDNNSNSEDEVATTNASNWKFDAHNCYPDQNGRPWRNPEGGFPDGFGWEQNCSGDPCDCELTVWKSKDEGQKYPPPNWNGSLETLGFDIEPGTPTFNMVMCWPVPKAENCHGFTDWISSEFGDDVRTFE